MEISHRPYGCWCSTSKHDAACLRVGNRSSGMEETKTKGRGMTRQDIDQYFAELERAGLFVKTGQLRQGQPVYVASEWGVKLRHDHPDLFNQIINTCDDLDVLQQIYDQHKDVLPNTDSERAPGFNLRQRAIISSKRSCTECEAILFTA